MERKAGRTRLVAGLGMLIHALAPAVSAKGAAAITQCSGAQAAVSVMRDDFDGTQIDAGLWVVDANAGSVTVAGGAARVASPSTTSFPLVTSAQPVIPQAGAFSVRWAAQYEQSTVHGTCTLAGARGLPVDGGQNDTIGAFSACQDNGVGYNVYVAPSPGEVEIAYSVPEDSLLRHEVEYCWLETRIEVWVDGVRRLDVARDASFAVPDSLWFGNYARGALDSPWSNFSLDFVEVIAFDASDGIFVDGFEAPR
jgi:hypothetical protein